MCVCVCLCLLCACFSYLSKFPSSIGQGPKGPKVAVIFVSCQIQSNEGISCLRSSLFWDFTQCRLVVVYGCFRTTCRSISTKMRKIPEERRSHLHRGGSRKSRNFMFKINTSRVNSAN